MISDKVILGPYEIQGLRDGFFSLDGGAMFGVVPKTLWEKKCPADEKNRIKLGICSSSKKTMVEKVLKGVFKTMEISESIYNFFDAFATAEDVRRKKPFPDIYLYVINKLNLHTSECLAIEDSEIGINSAKSAGCRVIGLITPFNTIDDIINADKIVKSLEEILKENFWGWFNDR